MLPNPYKPGEPTHVLGGRSRELARITERLERVSALGDYGGSLLIFHSPRGIGKTSLLRTAERVAVDERFVSAWVSASPGSSLLSELAYRTRVAVDEAPFITAKQKKAWGVQVRSLEVQLGVPGAFAGKAVIEGAVSRDEAPLRGASATTTEAPTGALEDLLRSSATLVRGAGGAGLIVFVDEVHAADTKSLSVILNALQNVNGAPSSTAVAVVCAGLPASPDVITAAATFGERSSFVELTRLADADCRVALVRPAQSSGVSWAAEALDRVVADASGFPYLVQLLGSTTWAAAEPGPGSTLTLGHVESGYEDALRQLETIFRARWKVATDLDRQVIVAMVEQMLETSAEDVDRAAVAQRLGRSSQSISTARDRLIGRGIVEAAGRGLMRFTFPGFAAFVARETDLAAHRDDPSGLARLSGVPLFGA